MGDASVGDRRETSDFVAPKVEIGWRDLVFTLVETYSSSIFFFANVRGHFGNSKLFREIILD